MARNAEITWTETTLSRKRSLPQKAGTWTITVSGAEKAVIVKNSSLPSQHLKLTKESLVTLVGRLDALTDEHPEKTAASRTPQEEAQYTKRQYKRYSKRCEARFTVEGMHYRAIAGDFSINGLFLKTGHPFGAATIVDMVVHLPDGKISLLRGSVRRSMRSSKEKGSGAPVTPKISGMGIELIEKDRAYLNFIRSLIV